MRRIIGLAVACLFLSACATCHQEANKSTLQCIVINDVVDCSTSTVVSEVNKFYPLINWGLGIIAATGAVIDWTAFGAAMAGLGLDVAGCIASQLEHDLTNASTFKTPMEAAQTERISRMTADYEAWYQPWRAAHFPPRIDSAGTAHPIKFRHADGSLR